MALVASGSHGDQPKVVEKVCYYCKKPGHIIRDCYKLKNKKKNDQVSESKSTNVDSPVSFMAVEMSCSLNKNIWIADSGSHDTKWTVVCVIQFFRKGSRNSTWEWRVYASGWGRIDSTVGPIENVYHVPKLVTNLFSIRSATQQNLVVQYSKTDVKFMKDHSTVLQGLLKNGIYILDLKILVPNKPIAMVATSISNWHKRFGHVSVAAIKDMARMNIVGGLKIEEVQANRCSDCAVGKSKHCSHPLKNFSRAQVPGQVLHLDTVVVTSNPSINGNMYLLLCKDEVLGFRMGAYVSSKSEISNQVKLMISETKLATGNAVLQICTDNGTEFLNSNLSDYLLNNGILHQKSLPYIHQQNGFIERDIRTVIESGRTLLLASGLPKGLWDEAVATSIYVLNRTTNSSNRLQTPFELWFGYRPDVANLRIFGESAVIYDQSYKRKFDSRGLEVKFVGYTKRFNSYRFFDGKKIVCSCDVKFVDDSLSSSDKSPALDTTFVSIPGNARGTSESVHHDSVSERVQDNVVDGYKDVMDGHGTTGESNAGDQSSSQDSSEFNNTVINNIHKAMYQSSPKTVSSAELDSSSTDEETVVHAKQLPKPKKGLSKLINLNLGKLGPFKSKQVDTTLAMSQPCIHRTISQSSDGRVQLEDDESPTPISDVCRLLATAATLDDPENYEEVLTRPDYDKWVVAMDEEMDSMRKNKVWSLVDVPKDANIISNRWVFVVKRKPTGEVDRYKARLVARGFSQVYGFDYTETYAPVASMPTFRVLFAFAAAKKLKMKGFDVKTAFLDGQLEEKIYMVQPPGYEQPGNKVCLLNRSLYGLKQSPRQWNKRFTDFVMSLELRMSENDNCVFYRTSPLVILAIYVDDGLLFAERSESIMEIMDRLKGEFEIHEVSLTSYLGFQIEVSNKHEILLHQKSYINKMLTKFEMEGCNSVSSPVSQICEEPLPNKPLEPSVKYREAVGSLMYTAVTTRPDIMYAVMRASTKLCNPTEHDWIAVKKIFRYLRGTDDCGILYSKTETLQAYCDADFACNSSSKSTSGIVFMVSGGPVYWRSQVQKIVTLSSTEAELVSLCTAVKDLIWLRKLTLEVGLTESSPSELFCDNQSTIKLSLNEKISQRTRHMSVRAAYPRDQVERKQIIIKYINTQDQLADLFTKPQGSKSFIQNRNKLVTKESLFSSVLYVC